MNADKSRKQAELLFKNGDRDKSSPAPDYEARARDIRQKIEYLRSLRLAAEARWKQPPADDPKSTAPTPNAPATTVGPTSSPTD